jgi:hypothetical protein
MKEGRMILNKMAEENKETIFDTNEEAKLNDIVALVNEPYTYENMVNNPIIKPISETDRSIRDLEEMEYKKLIDIKRLKDKINSVIGDVPSYQDSSFIADLIKLSQCMDDVIKLQDIMLTLCKGCIKNIHKDVQEHYGVKQGEAEEYVEPTSVIPEGSILAYLEKLSNNPDEKISNIAKEIKDIFIKTTRGKDDQEKFQSAGIEYYGKTLEKDKRKIAAKIVRMEIP